MAAPLGTSAHNSIDHRRRKNGASAEFYAKQRFERNAARGKQIWVGGSCKEGGHWERTSITVHAG